MDRINVAEMSNEELVQLQYDVTEEMEARLIYGRPPIELTEEEIAQLPY